MADAIPELEPHLAAIREECRELTREQLLRRIAALSRRLDTETVQHHNIRKAYAKAIADLSSPHPNN